jgi:hypothetical protein
MAVDLGEVAVPNATTMNQLGWSRRLFVDL